MQIFHYDDPPSLQLMALFVISTYKKFLFPVTALTTFELRIKINVLFAEFDIFDTLGGCIWAIVDLCGLAL